MTVPAPDPGRPAVPYRISLGVGAGSLLQPLNSSMIAVALVTIATELRIDSGITWLISGLYLATAVAAPTAGRLADLYGARRVFFSGLVLALDLLGQHRARRHRRRLGVVGHRPDRPADLGTTVR